MKLFVLIACVFFAAQSCKLKKEECSCVAASCAQGFIYWGGPYAADGIGWYFAEKREGNWLPAQLKEEELPNEFKNFNDSIAVTICLQKTNERAPCFCASPSYFYKIVRIEKR
ncbi:MAG: hypothetical protein KGZ74_17360 [Chitinophagaceae bacterium]|nr:hypothetical protein [Chitinophagaceae bacterium]